VDKTDEYVKEFSDDEVRLFRQEIRKGKTAALNMAVPQAKGEIIIFSDANSMYDRSAIKKLVRHFQDPTIGFVTGKTKYVSRHGSSVTESTSLYNKLECLTKRLESRVGSCVGADGAIFAIRKELYKPLQAYDINDFVIPLKIVEQGYRGILDDEAFCVEEMARNTQGEFNRQVRITSRTIRAIVNNKALLNPIKFPLFSFEVVSHKLMKFILPFFIITIFITNCLIITTGFLYYLILALQTCFYILACWGYIDEKTQNRKMLTSMAYTFSLVNLAIFIGWIKYFSGETYSTWSPERT
jgi:cellulose synthase/poly-beta-1,6-N-acetylglucosamine synthase-like glycosyltransferase